MLLKFFINPQNSSYLRGLESEIDESSNSIRLELNRFEKAGLLESYELGNKKMFKANEKHPMFLDVISIVKKYVGIDIIIQNIVDRLGDLKQIYLAGDLAKGIDSSFIQIVLIGNINTQFLNEIILKTEKIIQKKITYSVLNEAEFYINLNDLESHLLLWQKDGS